MDSIPTEEEIARMVREVKMEWLYIARYGYEREEQG